MERFGMTAREADVALRLARGERNRTIASELRISPHTARHHTESVLAKLDVHTRAEVMRAIM
jgi:DNA-binding CsgD family transcriptional regulator